MSTKSLAILDKNKKEKNNGRIKHHSFSQPSGTRGFRYRVKVGNEKVT